MRKEKNSIILEPGDRLCRYDLGDDRQTQKHDNWGYVRYWGKGVDVFQAAGFIDIVKADDYLESNKVKIARKMVTCQDGTKHFFYERYASCIGCSIETQIKWGIVWTSNW